MLSRSYHLSAHKYIWMIYVLSLQLIFNEKIVNVFNSFHDKLKFTLKIEVTDKLSVLDMILMRNKGKINVD